MARNHAAEAAAQQSFDSLQQSIYTTYGLSSPAPPTLRLRNATQTSLVLEWDPIELATADLRSLALYRNGAKAGAIPRPRDVTSTKISGLAVDHEYTFQLVLRTSAGTHASPRLTVRTHKMTDLSGITVTPGVLAAQQRYALAGAVERIGGKLVEGVRIDTTHFVCTEGRGRDWERAVEMNIPVVRPEWVEGCEREGRIVGVRGYYLNADPKQRQIGQGVGAGQQGQGRQRTESGAGAPRVPPATGASDGGSARDGPQMAVLPPESASTDVSGISPGTVTGKNGRAAPDPDGPPTPPAKDQQPRLASREPSASSVGGPSEAEDDDEDDEDEGNEDTEEAQSSASKSPQGSRNLVQSPFDSMQKASDVAHCGGPPITENKNKDPSDGGSFSEVAL